MSFADWLYARSPGSPKLIVEFDSHVPFIQRLDATFANAAEVSALALLDQFGSKLLRRHLLVTIYLQQTLGLELSAEQRADSSSDDLVAQTLRESASAPWGKLLSDYVAALDVSNLAARTRRMYVRTAANLCQSAGLSPDHVLTTSQLGRFLSHNPSARTNIARFVRHGAEQWGWNVSMPARTMQHGIKDANMLIKTFKSQLDVIVESGLHKASVDELGALLATAYGYSIELFNANDWSIAEVDRQAFLNAASVSLRVPPELLEIAGRWLELRSNAEPSIQE